MALTDFSYFHPNKRRRLYLVYVEIDAVAWLQIPVSRNCLKTRLGFFSSNMFNRRILSCKKVKMTRFLRRWTWGSSRLAWEKIQSLQSKNNRDIFYTHRKAILQKIFNISIGIISQLSVVSSKLKKHSVKEFRADIV